MFWDWLSLPQQPRATEQDSTMFKSGLQSVNLWYTHPLVETWLLTSNSPGVKPYGERGWPTFECGVSGLITPAHALLDIGKFDAECVSWPTTLQKLKSGRPAPALPEVFSQKLAAKTFTNNSDHAFVEGKYRDTFLEVMGSVDNLDFSNLDWGEVECRELASALAHCRQLQVLMLIQNSIDDSGISVLAAALPQCACLQHLNLKGNAIGDAGAEQLAAALPQNPELHVVRLSHNKIGNRGAAALAHALPRCAGLQHLVLANNKIGYPGGLALGKALPECANLYWIELRGLHASLGKEDKMKDEMTNLLREWTRGTTNGKRRLSTY